MCQPSSTTQYLSMYCVTFSGGNTVNELDQGDILFEPGDKKMDEGLEQSLPFFPLEWVVKK